MRRYLVVANLTLGGEHLTRLLGDRVAEAPCAFHVLVPASVDPHPHAWTHDDVSDRELAARRLDEALERFGDLDAEVTGEVGDHRPVDAILDVLRRQSFDEIILSTLPAGASRWLRLDLVNRVRRAVDAPVTHVVSTEVPAATA